MNRRRVLALSGGLLAAGLAGCVEDEAADETEGTDDETNDTQTDGPSLGDNDEDTDNNDEDDELSPELASLVKSTNVFAFNLYDGLLEENDEQNLLSSPVSIGLALAMAYAGAREETREQMRDVLQYELEDDAVHRGFRQLQDEFDRRSDIDEDEMNEYEEEPAPFELSIANSAWGQEEFDFEATFLDIVDSFYGGGFETVDYASDPDAARQDINEWVATETEDRIDELLPEGALDTLTRLVLVNAVYFLANWKRPFAEEQTETATFTALDGSEHDVQMMSRSDTRVPYAEHDGAQAVELPYVGDEVAMLVIVPPANEFERYENELDAETLSALVSELDSQRGAVKLPRFAFESGYELGEPLQALGMEDAFDQRAANFEGITTARDDLHIDQVYHDTFVSVDEEGTEAAAATGVVMGVTSAPADPFEFVADRPFLFAVRDRPTGAVLFLGRAVDPTGWE